MAEQPPEDGERRQDAPREETDRRGVAGRRHSERRVAERRTKDLGPPDGGEQRSGQDRRGDRPASRNGATSLGGFSPIAEIVSLDVRTRRTLPPRGPVGAREATCLRMTHCEVRHP